MTDEEMRRQIEILSEAAKAGDYIHRGERIEFIRKTPIHDDTPNESLMPQYSWPLPKQTAWYIFKVQLWLLLINGVIALIGAVIYAFLAP